jgi:hypothetical protein
MTRATAILAMVAMLGLLGGCAQRPSLASPDGSIGWGAVCYPGFDAEVERVVGSNAIDCGFYDRPADALQAAAWACMRRAIEQGRIFKVGYLSSGDDSQYCHSALRLPDKRFVEIFYDFDVTGGNATDGQHSSLQLLACDEIENKPSLVGEGSFFGFESCGPVPDRVRRIFYETAGGG